METIFLKCLWVHFSLCGPPASFLESLENPAPGKDERRSFAERNGDRMGVESPPGAGGGAGRGRGRKEESSEGRSQSPLLAGFKGIPMPRSLSLLGALGVLGEVTVSLAMSTWQGKP